MFMMEGRSMAVERLVWARSALPLHSRWVYSYVDGKNEVPKILI